MIKSFLYPEGKFNAQAAFVLLTAVLSGAAAAGLAIIVNEAAGEIIAGRVHLKHLPFFLLDGIFFILVRRIALKRGIELIEGRLEQIRNHVCNQIRQAELMGMERVDRSELYLAITSNTQMVSTASQAVIRVTQSLVVILVVFGYILFLSTEAGLLLMGLFLAGVVYHRWYEQVYPEKNRDALHKETELFEKIGHIIDGFKELKINRVKGQELIHDHLRAVDEEAKQHRIELGRLRAMYDAMSFIFLFYLSLGCIAFLLPDDLVSAVKFKVVAASAFLWEPISALSLSVPLILKAKVALEDLARIQEKFLLPTEVFETVYDPDYEGIAHFNELMLREICFYYKDSAGGRLFSIGPINLTLKKGEVVFLIGGNGSGKSTLLKVITGLYPPTSGAFLMDGRELHMSEHGYLFSGVFSDFHLFEKPYGIEKIDADKVNELIEGMFLKHKVQYVDQRFIYSGLSTGQMKRLALIVALLEDKPVYVFDEWAAEQDPEFRNYFYHQLLPQMRSQGKTVIAVTHDERYFHTADRVHRLEDGLISVSH